MKHLNTSDSNQKPQGISIQENHQAKRQLAQQCSLILVLKKLLISATLQTKILKKKKNTKKTNKKQNKTKQQKGNVCYFTEKKLPNLTLQGTNQKRENGRTNKYKLNKHKDKKEERNIRKYANVYRMKTLRERCSHKTTICF